MRRAPVLFLLAFAALLSTASSAMAQGITGTWELSWETPRGPQTVTFVFRQDGLEVTGAGQMRMGEVPIRNGVLDGDRFTFSIEFGRGERTMTQTFAATVTGDTMEGVITTPRGENPFKGIRKEG